MLMMKIQLDTAKIAAEKRYSEAAIRRTLEAAFAQLELHRVETDGTVLVCRDSGSAHDYARFGQLVNTLKKQPWFMENVALWRLYDSDDAETIDECSEEDLLRRYRRRAS